MVDKGVVSVTKEWWLDEGQDKWSNEFNLILGAYGMYL